jgi:hypothetical protein
MLQQSLQAKPQRKSDALGLSLENLHQALVADVSGREQEWLKELEAALSRAETALRQHRDATHAPDGALAEVDETRPTLARQADGLRGDQEDLLNQFLALREEVRRTTEHASNKAVHGYADVVAIREKAGQLLAGLQENKEAQTKLVLESVNTDIGVGD